MKTTYDYKEDFRCIAINMLPGEIFRQHNIIPYLFVSDYGRCISIAEEPEMLKPYEVVEEGKTYYYYNIYLTTGFVMVKKMIDLVIFPEYEEIGILPIYKMLLMYYEENKVYKSPYIEKTPTYLLIFDREMRLKKLSQRMLLKGIEPRLAWGEVSYEGLYDYDDEEVFYFDERYL